MIRDTERPECSISIIVPVLHEAGRMGEWIEHIREQGNDNVEIIVVDGDPGKSTINTIVDPAVTKISSMPGRARQMNAGSQQACGEYLFFLHADTRLPEDAFESIQNTLSDPQIVAGAFDLEVESHRWSLRLISCCSRLRNRLLRIPYGDQGIFIRRSYFEKIGRFAEIPIMEDIELMRRIKRQGDRITILRRRIRTSARRWEKEGILYTTVRNLILSTLFYLGASPDKLARYYRKHEE